MLFAHGSDLCQEAELRHATANCFEAVMGAIFLDAGIEQADEVFGKALYGADEGLYKTWKELEPHPLQVQHPEGDRHLVAKYPVLKVS